MKLNRRRMIVSGAALAFASGFSRHAYADQVEGAPLRFDWLPTGTNYNSSRSNRGKRPSVNVVIAGIARPEGQRLFQVATTLTPTSTAVNSGNDGNQMVGDARFQIERGGQARQRFDLRISRLDRSLGQFLEDQGEMRIPPHAEFGIEMDVGQTHYEFRVPLREILVDADQLLAHRLLIRGAVARAGDPGQIQTFFMVPTDETRR